MPVDERLKTQWEAMRVLNRLPILEEPELPLKGGGGGGTSNGMTVPIKDYVDARDAAVTSDMHAEFAKLRSDLARLPSTATLITTGLVIVGIILAAMAFGGDRFSAGISLADQRQQQLQRDQAQDAAAKRNDVKLDEILKRLPSKR
jgi:hypothetical protein